MRTKIQGVKQPIRPWIVSGLKVLVSGFLLLFVLSKINIHGATERISHAKFAYLGLALVLALILPWILAIRWWILARKAVSWSDALAYTWIGLFFGLILPGSISGDVAKGGLLAWAKSSSRRAILPASIFADRLVGLAVMLVFFIIGSFVVADTTQDKDLARFSSIAWRFGSIALAVLFSALIPFVQRMAISFFEILPQRIASSSLKDFIEATFAYSEKPSLLLSAGLLSAISQSLGIAMYSVLMRALSVELDTTPTIALYSIFAVLGMLPISFAGVGVRDWFAVLFLAAYRLPPEIAVAFTWLCLSMNVCQAVVGGIWQFCIIEVGRT